MGSWTLQEIFKHYLNRIQSSDCFCNAQAIAESSALFIFSMFLLFLLVLLIAVDKTQGYCPLLVRFSRVPLLLWEHFAQFRWNRDAK